MTKVKDLNAHRFNPRKMSDNKKENLAESADNFGDLGGIVYNRTTDRLASGHQRVSVLDPESKIVIVTKYDSPTATGTVAEGYIDNKGERWTYREVEWPEKKETEALLMANKMTGDWDAENLRILFANSQGIDIRMTGFTANELEMYDIEIPEIEVPDLVIPEVVLDEPKEETDEQYIRNNKGPEDEIRQERIPPKTEYTNTSAPKPDPEPVKNIDPKDHADDVEIDEEIKEKRSLIVIDAKNPELKAMLKDKIKPLLEGTEAIMA